MNKRIKELYALTCLGAGNLSEEDFCEKFAELIVRECAEFVSNDRQNDDYGVFVSNRIKQHFGVEE